MSLYRTISGRRALRQGLLVSLIVASLLVALGVAHAGSESDTEPGDALTLQFRPGMLASLERSAPSLALHRQDLQRVIQRVSHSSSMRSIAMRANSATSLLAPTDAAFTDTAGDSAGGLSPDVSTVAVINDASGNVGIGASYNNRLTCVGGGDFLLAYLDVDRNSGTGAAPIGYEYVLVIDGTNRIYGALRWDGAQLQEVNVPSLQAASCQSAGRLDAWFLNSREIGITAGFNFVIAGVYRDSAGTNYVDYAPDAGVWTYQLSSTPTPPPPPGPPPPPSPPPPPAARTFDDAPSLPNARRYTGRSVRQVKFAGASYATAKLVYQARSLQVACWSERDWDTAVRDVGGDPDKVAGFWYRLLPRFVHIAPFACRRVQGLVTSRKATALRAVSVAILMHEVSHLHGIYNEAQATCYGVQLVYYFARRVGVSPRGALTLERLGVQVTRRAVASGYWNASRCRDGGVWDLDDEGKNLSY